MELPLVSIGLPTYNRPKEFKRALEHILKQSYTNFELIVSDNNSSEEFKEEYLNIINSFNDHRVKYYSQNTNIGINSNYQFVLRKAVGKYFLWAADDDFMVSNDHIEILVHEIQSGYHLVFPNVCTNENQPNEKFNETYISCRDQFSYLKAWCSDLIGFPVYGLFDRQYLIDNKYDLIFDTKYYYLDCIFLHKFFLASKVSYKPDAYINYTKSNSFKTFSNFFMIKSYVRMFFIVIPFFYKAKLTFKQRMTINSILVPNYIKYLFWLCFTFIVRSFFSIFGYSVIRKGDGGISFAKRLQ